MGQGNRHALTDAAKRLAEEVDKLSFADPVTNVYNPLDYAWQSHQAYLSLVGNDISVLFLGMNPGPGGMAQTGVPFGEIDAVRDWMKIHAPVGKPRNEHPKRPIEGFDCERSEVSGRRLWGLFKDRFGTAKRFFKHHFVVNYCPLVFMEQSARNRTPYKLPAAERDAISAICDAHLNEVIQILAPAHLVGVGVYAEGCLKRAIDSTGSTATLARILHPSPASPAANKDWAGKATEQLEEAGIW